MRLCPSNVVNIVNQSINKMVVPLEIRVVDSSTVCQTFCPSGGGPGPEHSPTATGQICQVLNSCHIIAEERDNFYLFLILYLI